MRKNKRKPQKSKKPSRLDRIFSKTGRTHKDNLPQKKRIDNKEYKKLKETRSRDTAYDDASAIRKHSEHSARVVNKDNRYGVYVRKSKRGAGTG